MSYLLLAYPVAIMLGLVFGIILGIRERNDFDDSFQLSNFKDVEFKPGMKHFKIVNFKH